MRVMYHEWYVRPNRNKHCTSPYCTCAIYLLPLFYPHESFLLLHVLPATVSGLNRRIESNSGMLTGPTRKHEFLDIHRIDRLIDRGDPTIFRLPPITGPLLKEMRTQRHVK